MRFLFLVLFIILNANYLGAQKSIEFNSFLGKVAKHKSEILYETPPYSLGGELTFSVRTSGEKKWHQRWNRPSMDLSLLHFYLGDNEVLGSLTAIIPQLGFYFGERRKSFFRFQFGTVIAYVTKRFDEISNPTNNAIGSNLNNIIVLRISHQWQLTQRINILSGISLTHFSNGRTSSPNRGINLPALSIGASFQLEQNKEETKPILNNDKIRKWGFNLHVGSGIKEDIVPGGPKYNVKIISIGGRYATDQFNHILFGWEYEYHDNEYSFAIATFIEEEQAQKEAKKQMLYLADELLFGKISLRFQIGY